MLDLANIAIQFKIVDNARPEAIGTGCGERSPNPIYAADQGCRSNRDRVMDVKSLANATPFSRPITTPGSVRNGVV